MKKLIPIILALFLTGISYAENEQMVDFEEESVPAVNEKLRSIEKNNGKIRYSTSVPTAATMDYGEIVVKDDGSTQAIYIKSGKGTLLELTITP